MQWIQSPRAKTYMKKISIIAMTRALWAEANCEDMTKETGSIVNVRLEMMFNTAIAT